jgi:hypothetical protein
MNRPHPGQFTPQCCLPRDGKFGSEVLRSQCFEAITQPAWTKKAG